MTAGLFARMPRVLVLVIVALLATTALALAAQGTVQTPPTTTPAVTPERPTVVVPDVRGQVYVFAKGALEQAGFAWKVDGPVKGYAANVVASQTPAPGSKVYVDGSPLVSLVLKANGGYKQEGTPEDASPYPGSPARLVGVPVAKAKAAATRTAQATAAANAPKAAATPKAKAAAKPKAKAADRTPDFKVAGAPAEPLDEVALTVRAANLKRWIAAHPKASTRNVNHWLYQHTWIVTGARFGWSNGAAALQRLIEADRLAQKLWGVGARSELVAREALAAVEAKAR